MFLLCANFFSHLGVELSVIFKKKKGIKRSRFPLKTKQLSPLKHADWYRNKHHNHTAGNTEQQPQQSRKVKQNCEPSQRRRVTEYKKKSPRFCFSDTWLNLDCLCTLLPSIYSK